MKGRCDKCGDYLTRVVWHGRRGDIIECLGCGFSWTRIRSVLFDARRPSLARERHRDD